MTFSFTYQPTSIHRARLGELVTPHGTLQTPAFIFCATKATLKGVTPLHFKNEKTQIILSNTYHLMLQPGSSVIKALGGLQNVTGWNGPMLTDSGGFQIFSLGHGSVSNEIKGVRNTVKTMLKITEEGATFRSYIDGKRIVLTPETSIHTQCELGADLIVVLDECTPYHVDKRYTEKSMHMSHRWALRSYAAYKHYHRDVDDPAQRLYGIVQGGVYPDLRKDACDFINSQPFFGHAVGGSLGASKQQMYDVVEMTMRQLTPERPTHLLGIGGLRDIYNGVQQGIDTFDCVHPTRLARHGGALVRPVNNPKEKSDHLNLNNAVHKTDPQPIEPDCDCYTCQNFSRGYIHHLLKAKEMLAQTLVSIHNIRFMNRYLEAIRDALKNNEWQRIEPEWLGDE